MFPMSPTSGRWEPSGSWFVPKSRRHSQPKVLPLELCVLQLHLTLQASGGVLGSCFWARSYPKCSIFRSLFLEPSLPKWEHLLFPPCYPDGSRFVANSPNTLATTNTSKPGLSSTLEACLGLYSSALNHRNSGTAGTFFEPEGEQDLLEPLTFLQQRGKKRRCCKHSSCLLLTCFNKLILAGS